jgi:hypothetical protein
MTRRIIRLGCAALAAAALAGCQADLGTGEAPASPPSSQPSSSSQPSPVPSGAPSLPARGIAACRAGALRLAQQPGGEGAAGTLFVGIGVTNTSTHPCTLRGYPQITLSHGTTALAATVVDGGLGGPFAEPVRTVTLAPGGTSAFAFAYNTVTINSGTSCPQADRMHLRLPGQLTRVVGPVQVRPLCSPSVRVSPFLRASTVF